MMEVENIERRWGTSVTTGATGFTAVPNVLIRYQYELGLSATELVVPAQSAHSLVAHRRVAIRSSDDDRAADGSGPTNRGTRAAFNAGDGSDPAPAT